MSFSSTKDITNFDLILSSCQIVEDSQEEPVLSSAMIQDAFAEAKIEFGRKGSVIYTMVVAFLGGLSEFFFTGSERSTTATVIRINQLLINTGEEGCSLNNGRYCMICSKIHEEVPKILAKKIALNMSGKLKEEELWNGHHVGLLDGTTFYAQDTASIQEKYPQSLSQKQGVDFPIIRGVAITSRETGMLHDIAIGSWRGKETGEMALFRSLIYKLKYNSNNLNLFVADRYFCTYFVFAILLQNDIHFLARLHHRRKLEEEDGKKSENFPTVI